MRFCQSIILSTVVLFTPTVSLADDECPRGLTKWTAWRDEILKEFKKSDYRSGLVGASITFRQCADSLRKLGPKKHCFEPLIMFSSSKYYSHKSGHTLGLPQSNAAYTEDMRSQGLGILPDVFLSQDVLSAFDQSKSASELAEMLEAVGRKSKIDALAFAYSSRHIESVDDAETLGRVFLRIKTKDADHFSQYAVGTSTGKPPQGISVISIQHSENGRKIARPTAYFNDLLRIRAADGTYQVKNRSDVTSQLEPCYSCHKSALIPIIPDLAKFDLVKYGERLARANDEMSKFAAARHKSFAAGDLGPGLGIKRVLSQNELSNCAGRSLSKAERIAVSSMLNCQECHNGGNRPVLSFPSGLPIQLPRNRGNIAELFLVDYGVMPPSLDPASRELRKIAFQCLKQEFYGTSDKLDGRLVSWLRNETCFEGPR